MNNAWERLYIAYGADLNLERMSGRCPTAKVLGKSVLLDWRLMFQGGLASAAATIEPCIGASVPVLIWLLLPQDEYELERCTGWPYFYSRNTMCIKAADGRKIEALFYAMDSQDDYGVPNMEHYGTIRHGYQSAGFDIGILDEAVRLSASFMWKTSWIPDKPRQPKEGDK